MIQGIAGIVIGLMFLAVGLGRARVSKNATANAAFVKKYGIFFIVAGPIVALVGLGMLVAALST